MALGLLILSDVDIRSPRLLPHDHTNGTVAGRKQGKHSAYLGKGQPWRDLANQPANTIRCRCASGRRNLGFLSQDPLIVTAWALQTNFEVHISPTAAFPTLVDRGVCFQAQRPAMATSYLDVTLPWAGLAAAAWVLAYYLYPYFVTYARLRGIPAPFPAQFTNLWLLSAARHGNRSLAVDAAHRKLGKVVRVAPNHVSINDEAAIGIIYGHGNGLLKSSVNDLPKSVVFCRL